jgi:ribonuclease Z
MHLDDLLERAEKFQNELIICAHFSTRYNAQEVRRLMEAKLPPSLRDRVKLWI